MRNLSGVFGSLFMAERIIRPLLASDLDTVFAIEQKAHAAPWSRTSFEGALQHGNYMVVLEEAHKILAFAVVQFVVDEAHLLDITVDPAYQGKGLGRYLLQHILDYAEAAEASTMFLEVRVSNESAQHLYRNMGFNELGVRKNYYPKLGGGREDAVLMAYSFVLS